MGSVRSEEPSPSPGLLVRGGNDSHKASHSPGLLRSSFHIQPSIFRDPDSFHLAAPLEALKSFTESSASCQETREERAEGIMQEVLGARKWFTLLTHHFSHSISRSQSMARVTAGKAQK